MTTITGPNVDNCMVEENFKLVIIRRETKENMAFLSSIISKQIDFIYSVKSKSKYNHVTLVIVVIILLDTVLAIP